MNKDEAQKALAPPSFLRQQEYVIVKGCKYVVVDECAEVVIINSIVRDARHNIFECGLGSGNRYEGGEW